MKAVVPFRAQRLRATSGRSTQELYTLPLKTPRNCSCTPARNTVAGWRGFWHP